MLKAVITTITLATSTAAVAQPAPYNTDPIFGDRYIPYDDRGRPYDSEDYGRRHPRTVMLARNVVLASHGQRQTFLPVTAGYTFTRLRFELLGGRTFVHSLHVVFADGHRETLPVQRMLSFRDPSFSVELPHGGITGLFVNTAPLRGRWNGGWRRPSGAMVNILAQRG